MLFALKVGVSTSFAGPVLREDGGGGGGGERGGEQERSGQQLAPAEKNALWSQPG